MKRAEVRKMNGNFHDLWVTYCWNCKSIAYYDTHAEALMAATRHCAVNR